MNPKYRVNEYLKHLLIEKHNKLGFFLNVCSRHRKYFILLHVTIHFNLGFWYQSKYKLC